MISIEDRRFRYRVAPVPVRIGTKVRCMWRIEVMGPPMKRWLPVMIRGVVLRYASQATADRHCAWMNDPKGTEPAWGQEEISGAVPGGERNYEQN